MNTSKKIKTALISVYHKDGLEPILYAMKKLGIRIFSTGGTQQFINSLGIPVTAVEDITSFPSILGGRVKTLHPHVFGGILSRRDNPEDAVELSRHEIEEIDLVIVDLYPFEETVAQSTDEATIIEKIDIGGISLIRAAAKNYKDVVVIPSKKDYKFLEEVLKTKEGITTIEDRKKMSARAFRVSSHYDTAIFNYMNGNSSEEINLNSLPVNTLRYGENPHQKGYFLGNLDQVFDQQWGKELSFNNLLDIESALSLINDFSKKESVFAIFKHTNPCGVAASDTILNAWRKALAGDPTSAFGGILISNQQVDEETATEINNLFFEVILAPGYDEAALNLLKQKKNRIILTVKNGKFEAMQIRTTLNGFLKQEKDQARESVKDLNTVTQIKPSEDEIKNLLFANKIVKNLKSNAIAIVKNEQLIGLGTGQTSRIDALKQAIEKAKYFNQDLPGSVMASDAFFPFPDCVEIAKEAGIRSIIQPGGSVKDQESIAAADQFKISMVFTGKRHFKH